MGLKSLLRISFDFTNQIGSLYLSLDKLSAIAIIQAMDFDRLQQNILLRMVASSLRFQTVEEPLAIRSDPWMQDRPLARTGGTTTLIIFTIHTKPPSQR